VSRYEDRYAEEKIYLEEKVVSPIEIKPVTVENKEEKIVQPALSSKSKSTSSTKHVWKVKVNSMSDSTQSEAPLDPSKVP
jgi:hypothetical protein